MELEDLDWADGPVRMLDRQPAASVARCTIRWARCCCGQNCCVSGCDKRRMESLAVEQHTVEHVPCVHVVLWEQQISAALQVWELAGVLVDSAGLARASDPQHTSIHDSCRFVWPQMAPPVDRSTLRAGTTLNWQQDGLEAAFSRCLDATGPHRSGRRPSAECRGGIESGPTARLREGGFRRPRVT